MSSVTTDFIMYFEDTERLNYAYKGFQLHKSEEPIKCAEYFKSNSKELYNLLKTGSMQFMSLIKEDDCLITGVIEGGTISYNPEILFREMALIGCKLSIINDFHDRVGEYERYAYQGSKRVRSTTAFAGLKKLSPTAAFKAALAMGRKKDACELLDLGANPNTLIEGRPAIEYAAWSILPTVVKKLVEKGADVNAISPSKALVESSDFHQCSMTALHQTVEHGSFSSVKFLLKNGANPNNKESNGWTMIESCMQYFDESFKTVIALIENGADLELREEEEGKTAFLSVASRSFCEEEDEDENDTSKLDILKHLVKYNADIYATCNKGGNAVWYAAEDDSDDVIINYLSSLGLTEKKIPSNAYEGNNFQNLSTALNHKDYFYFKENIKRIESKQEKIELFANALTYDDIVIAEILITEGIGPLDMRRYEKSYMDDVLLIDIAKDNECKKKSIKILQLFEKTQ